MLTDAEKRALIAEARSFRPGGGAAYLEVRLADALEQTLEGEWQYSYVEKWADGSGVYERVTFPMREQAAKYLGDNAESVQGFNSELGPGDRIVASIERRKVVTPGEWEVVPDGNVE